MTSWEMPELLDLAVLDDVLGDEDSLREQVDALLETVEPADSYQAADPSESIWVTVDPDGRLVDVLIRRTWPEHLEPATFGDALLGAYTAAAEKAMAVRMSTWEDQAPVGQPQVAATDELSHEEWLARVRGRLDEVDAMQRAMARAETESPGEQEIRGVNGYLTMLTRAGGLVSITANPAVAYAELERLREDVLDIFEDAGLFAGEETR
jgi:hypothetical protein